jgi:hypothetical protein
MQRPDPFELFCFYNLGIDRNGWYKFRNLRETARYFGTSSEQIMKWLQEDHIDPETVRKVDFNLSKAHVDIQILSYTAPKEEILAAARERFNAYLEALKRSSLKEYYFDMDYEDPFKKD